NPHNVIAAQVPAIAHPDFLTATNVQEQLDQAEINLGLGFRNDKIFLKDKYQTGLIRPDTDTTVITVSPADTVTITDVNNVLFINEVLPDSNANEAINFVLNFGDIVFTANATNTLLATNTRGIFYIGIDKLGNQVYRTSRVYDQDVCYLARILVQNSAGVYSVIATKYFPDLGYNEPSEKDRKVTASGYLVPSGAASISFGNRAVTFQKNSINYSNNKLDPNFLAVPDSVNPTPMSFVFALPNIVSLATPVTPVTTINPKNWYLANGTLGGSNVADTNYQVYRLLVTVTGTLVIQTIASTDQNPHAGTNAIFANKEDALLGLASVVFPDVLPAGDSIVLGKFFLRAGTPANGSGMNSQSDFHFEPVTTSFSSSSVGVTVHDLLSGKNDNPAFQHVTTSDIANWNLTYTNIITSLTTVGNSGVATLIANVLNIPNYTLVIGNLPVKSSPYVPNDLIVIGDSEDGLKTKTNTYQMLVNSLKSYFDTIYSSSIEQISITTSVSITTATTDATGNTQYGKNVLIKNGASPINIVVDGVQKPTTYQKEGT
ncbi:MAG: hypothetical protein ACRC2J_01460, partial [Microcoleaceae cyanobacterium]